MSVKYIVYCTHTHTESLEDQSIHQTLFCSRGLLFYYRLRQSCYQIRQAAYGPHGSVTPTWLIEMHLPHACPNNCIRVTTPTHRWGESPHFYWPWSNSYTMTLPLKTFLLWNIFWNSYIKRSQADLKSNDSISETTLFSCHFIFTFTLVVCSLCRCTALGVFIWHNETWKPQFTHGNLTVVGIYR